MSSRAGVRSFWEFKTWTVHGYSGSPRNLPQHMNAHWGGSHAGQARTQYGIINTWLCSSILTACGGQKSSKMKAATFVVALNKADVLCISNEIYSVITGRKRQAPQATMDGTVDKHSGQHCGQLVSYVAT